MLKVLGSSFECDVPHDTVGTLAQFFGDIVSFINNEILVENLEVLATSHVRHLVMSLALAVDRLRIWDGRPETETMRRMNWESGRCDLIMDETEDR